MYCIVCFLCSTHRGKGKRTKLYCIINIEKDHIFQRTSLLGSYRPSMPWDPTTVCPRSHDSTPRDTKWRNSFKFFYNKRQALNTLFQSPSHYEYYEHLFYLFHKSKWSFYKTKTLIMVFYCLGGIAFFILRSFMWFAHNLVHNQPHLAVVNQA